MALFYCSIFNPLQNSKFSWIGCSSHCFCCADGSTSFVQVQLERIVRKIDARQTFVILGFNFETWTWDFFSHMICVNVLWRKNTPIFSHKTCYWKSWKKRDLLLNVMNGLLAVKSTVWILDLIHISSHFCAAPDADSCLMVTVVPITSTRIADPKMICNRNTGSTVTFENYWRAR